MPRRLLRLLALAGLALVLLAALALLVLHTPPIQSRVLEWSIEELERRFALDLTADRLRYNLLSLRVTMTGVRLAAAGHHDQPFFTAEEVTVHLPWAVVRGRLRFDRIEVPRGRVTVVRDEQGVSNLPRGGAPRDPTLPPRQLDVRELEIGSLDFLYADERRDIEIRAPRIHADLGWDGVAAAGPFSIQGSTHVRIGERELDIDPVDGRVAFDGSHLALADLDLDTTDGAFVLNGSIQRVLDRMTLDLVFRGTTPLERSSRWFDPPISVAGPVAVEAHMTGPPSEFELDARLSSAALTVGMARDVALDAAATLTLDRLVVSRSSIRPATGGEIAASVDLPFGGARPWRVEASYREIEARTAFRLAEVEPLPFGAVLSGTATIDRPPGEEFRLEIHNTSEPRRSPGTAPLGGRVDFFVEGSRWSASQDHQLGTTHVTGDLGGVWDRARVARSTFEGRLDVTSGDVGEAARHAALFGLETPRIVQQARGPVTAVVDLGGTFVDPQFRGALESDGIELPPVGRVALRADFEASEHVIAASGIEASSGPALARGSVAANLDTRALSGELTVTVPRAADLLSEALESLRLDGELSARVVFGGTVETPDISSTITGQALALAGQPISSLAVRARLAGDIVQIDRAVLEQPSGGRLEVSGRYDIDARSYTAEVEGQQLLWQGTLGRLGDAAVAFSLTFDGSGTLDRPTGEGTIEFSVAGGTAGALVDRGIARVRLRGDAALVTLHVPSLGAFVNATVAPRPPFTYDAVIVMNRVPLEPLVALAGVETSQVTGTASLSATASGILEAVAGSQVFVNLQDIAASASGVPVQLTAPARIAWNGDALTIDALDVAVGQGRLVASGRLGEGGLEKAEWESRFTGRLEDLVQIGHALGIPGELSAAGAIAFEWRSSGGLDASTASLHIERASVGWDTVPPIQELVVEAGFDGTTLTIAQFTGRWQGGGIEGTASIPRGVLESPATGAPLAAERAGFAKLRVAGMTEQALAPWVSRQTLEAIDGRISATLDARITGTSIAGVGGTLVVDEAAFTIAGVPVEQQHASVFAFNDGVVTPRDVVIVAGGSPLTLTGSARLMPAEVRALDLELRGTADLRILSAFAPMAAIGGVAEIEMGVGGTPQTPIFSGKIGISRAEVAIREPRIVIDDLNGTIALDGQRVVFDAFHGTANGGGLTLDGGFLLEGVRPARGGLTVVLDGAALEYPQGLQSEVNAIATIRPDTPGWSIVGDVIVERSAYTQTISLAALVAARDADAPSALDSETWQDQLRLNLWVTTLADIVVDNNYGRFEATAALRVVGTVAEPVLNGRITLIEGGEIYLAGNTFYIERGSISFTNPFRIVPEFDVQLRTLVRGTDITLTLDGPIDRLRTDVRSSDPTVDSREAVSLLFGGLEGGDALTLLSTELLGATGRVIGLDTLRVERGYNFEELRADPGLVATETDPSTRLTLSKRLRPDVEVILSQSLRESGGLTAIVSYNPARNIELRAVSRDNLDRSVALRHEITFGGEGTPLPQAADRPLVSSIAFSGNTLKPEAELRAQLELAPGDTFNFYEWQRDIDRLRQVYYNERRFEAGVRGHREVSQDGRHVALEYEIEPGPVTDLVVVGHDIDDGLREDILAAWRRTIFDRFLLEDIRARVQRHLLGENYIGSTVEAEIATATSERKEIRVTITPGTRVESREVHYSGNAAFDARRLDRVVAGAGLQLDGWLDPTRIAEVLDEFYRSQGFLAVSVQAGAPVVEGTRGILPVTIDEGPRYTIGSVSYPGVSPQRLAEVTTAANLQPGAPYVTAAVADARRRVEVLYGEEGFNTLQIEVNATPSEESATVDVEFAVLEGLQQVLQDVSVIGATRTDDDVVRGALRLRIGEPVDLGAWAQARKRLYDTNVFRQVDIEPVPLDPTAEQSAAGIQPVRAVVRVVEYPVWRLRYGAQLTHEHLEQVEPGADDRVLTLGVLADLQNQNLFGRAITAGIAARYERDRQAGNLFTSNSTFFGLPIRSSGFIFASRQQFEDRGFTTIDQRMGVTAEQRWRPFTLSEVIWSYRFERTEVLLPDLPAGELQPLPVRVARLNAAMYLDRRDDPTDPNDGWFSSASWEQAVRALGSDYASGKILAQYSTYRGIGRVVLAGRAQAGTSYGETLLPSERFRLGGATTVRGYAENALGPRNLFEPTEALVNINGELRFPIWGWVRGVAFVDAGNVFASRGDVSFADLFVGYGLGLRLASPFAMLRVDFGIPARALVADRPANRLGSGRWYFGVGHIF